MARSSACAVGSRRVSVRLAALARTSPAGLMITAPIGTSPRSRACSASASASSIGRTALRLGPASASFVIMEGKVRGKRGERQAVRSDQRLAARRPPPPRPQEPMRIAKAMAHAGLCSRRDAEAWIAAGRVSANGKVLTTPAHVVSPGDRIMVDGEPLPASQAPRLWRYHKPRGLITSHKDPQGRRTVFDALPPSLPRVVSVGRLDINTEGLLLLTTDGALARHLELPETGWLRRYRVRAHGRVTQEALNALRGGVEIGGIRYGAIEAAVDREQGSNVWLTFAIREGKNREVRNVLEHLGLQVNRLIRVSFGPFQLGEMQDGTVEEVRTRMLRDQLGERVTALAGADFTGPISDLNIAKEETEAPLAPVREHRGRDR